MKLTKVPLNEKKRLFEIALCSVEITGNKTEQNEYSVNEVVEIPVFDNSDKSLPSVKELPNFAAMAQKYTIPQIKKGKIITNIPKGSSKRSEQTKQTWYIEFYYYDTASNKLKRCRKTDNLNRIKNPREKEEEAERLCVMYKELLDGGWSPFDEDGNEQLRRDAISISVKEASQAFIQFNKDKGNRKKTIQSYESKLKILSAYFNDTKVNAIKDNDANNFLIKTEKKLSWSANTYNSAKTIYYGLFQYLILEKYLADNPFKGMKGRSTSKSEKHQVFSEEHFQLIMDSLRNDPYTDFFCKSIYYTCIRPKELRALQVKHVDLEKGVITVPANIAKNKKLGYINIDANYRAELIKLNLQQFPAEYYLTGSTRTIIGAKEVGINTPYSRFINHLTKLNLLSFNYTLYSFKHLSNVKKFQAGWTLAEIMKANRHASIEETENYLRDLMKFIDISKKEVPAI